jgi:hypothetical protein
MSHLDKSCLRVIVVAFAAALCPANLSAQTYIYANNGDPTKPSYVYKIDLSNGTVVKTYTNLEPTFLDGRGVAVIGSRMYYTTKTSNCIFEYDLIAEHPYFPCTGFDVPGESELGALASDGQNLWVVGGSNTVYKCGPGPCTAAFPQYGLCYPWLPLNCDALEYFKLPGTPYSGGALVL